MGDWEHADQSDYEQYLLQQQAELPLHTLNDMTLDERITEYIEWQNSEFDKRLMVDAHLEIIKLRAENARLDQALADTAAQLTDAVQRAQEAEYNLHLMKKQADAFHAENATLREQLRKAYITTVARRFSGDMDCEGDGSGPGCENPVVWEIQAMDDGGSQYAYVCADHLSDYQRWADGDGRSPMVFELGD